MNRNQVIMFVVGAALIAGVAITTSQRNGSQAVASNPSDAPVPASRTAVSSNALTVAVRLDQSAVLHGDNAGVAMVEVIGSETAATTRTPVSMAIVLDNSGSMSGQKIVDARNAAHALVDQLSPGDQVTVIAFNSGSRVLVRNQRVDTGGASIHSAINTIESGGGTCIRCGLQDAYGALIESDPGRLNRVVLLSDGNGSSSAADLRRLSANALEQHVPTSTIGLGRDYNEDVMVQVARGGDGDYYFLPNSDAIAEVLERELASLSQTVARNVQIRLTPSGGVTIGASNSIGVGVDGNDALISLRQISAGEVRRFIVPLTYSSDTDGNVLRAAIDFATDESSSNEFSLQSAIVRTDSPSVADASRDADVVVQTQTLASVNEIDSALERFQSGDSGGAYRQLNELADSLSAAAEDTDSDDLAEEAEEVRALVETMQEQNVAPASGAAREIQMHNSARSNEARRGRDRDQMYYGSAQ